MRLPAPRPLMLRTRRLIDRFDWATFLADAWGRHPAVARAPFVEPLLRQQDFFATLVDYRGRLEQGESCEVTLYDRDGVALSGSGSSDRSLSPLTPWLPTSSDRDFEGYSRRLTAEDRYQRFGLFVNRIHEHPSFWVQVREILAGLREHIEVPSASLNTDVFIGNYAKTTFGAHRDQLDNLLVMVAGRRRLRLWSHDAFCSAMGPCDPDDTFQDYSRALATSQTFELEAGDLLYWPADYWHVGEGDDDLSISFNIDFPVPDEDERVPLVVQRAIDRVVEEACEVEETPLPPAFVVDPAMKPTTPSILEQVERSVARVRDAIASSRLEREVAGQYLRWSTAGGFLRVPPPVEMESCDLDAWIQVDPRHPVRAVEVDGHIVVAACGHSFVAPSCEALFELIVELNRGVAVRVGDCLHRYGGRVSQGPTGRQLLAEDGLLWMLTSLVRFRGAFVVDVGVNNRDVSLGRVGEFPVVRRDELVSTDLKSAQERLDEYGVAVVDGVLDHDLCDALAAEIQQQRVSAPPSAFGTIHARKRRFDLPLPYEGVTAEGLRRAAQRLGPFLSESIGLDAELVELSSLTSLPGAKGQTTHPDSQFGSVDTARLLTLFVALDDVDASMGPLSVWPGTHRSRFFENEELRREVLALTREVKLALPKGSAVIIDSRTWHRGGANRSTSARPIFYFSLVGAGTRPEGPTYSMRSDHVGKLRLRDLLPTPSLGPKPSHDSASAWCTPDAPMRHPV